MSASEECKFSIITVNTHFKESFNSSQSRGLDFKQSQRPESFSTSPANQIVQAETVKDTFQEIASASPPPFTKKVFPENFEEIRAPIKILPDISDRSNVVNNNSEDKAQKVAITSFIRSNCVYIRNADENTNKRFQMIHKVVEQLSQNLHSITSLPEENTYLIVNVDGFKRCTVQEVKGENRIRVFLSDSGKQEIVAMTQLYEPGPRLEKLAETSFIKMMNLEHVPEFYLNKKAAEYIKYVLSDEVFLEVEFGSTPDKGRIFDVVKNEFINDVLFCYAQDEEPEIIEYEPEEKEFTFVSEEIVKIDVS